MTGDTNQPNSEVTSHNSEFDQDYSKKEFSKF